MSGDRDDLTRTAVQGRPTDPHEDTTRCQASAPPPGPALPDSLRKAFEGLRYRPLRFHAAGGLGEVFVARDEELGREVALKRIKDGRPRDTDSHERFTGEGEITGRLEHPGIVPVYGLGRDAAGQPYYTMRFIRGETLKEAVARFHQGRASGGREPPGEPAKRPGASG